MDTKDPNYNYKKYKNDSIVHINKNVYAYLKKFELPSLFEGMPNVILEAMECVLPIISTDCYDGNREIIEPSLEAQEEIYEKITNRVKAIVISVLVILAILGVMLMNYK